MTIWLSGLLILAGTFFIFTAAVGILRMPDVLMRMHAATKAGSLGVGLILLGVAVHFKLLNVTIEVLFTIFFIVITAPIASHLIARASYFDGIQLSKSTFIDELKPYYNEETHQLQSPYRESGRKPQKVPRKL